MRLNINTTTERFVSEMLRSYTMAWKGQRIYSEACKEANTDDPHAPWQYRMDIGEMMQKDGDRMANDVGERAVVAGVDMDDLLYRVEQLMRRPRVPSQKRRRSRRS
jgi:hypothetical protein